MGKSKYETHVAPKLPLIEKWARDGLTMEQIAENLGISRYSLIKYRDAHVDLFDTLKSGREVADAHVTNKLYQAAIGFYYTEEVMAASGAIQKIERYSKPNTTAMIFWLKNRDPDNWRDKKDVEHSGDVNMTFVEDLPDDDSDA